MTETTIYTIGHSTHPIDEFLEILASFKIKTLVDVRRLPGSRKFPQFDKENLETSLKNAEIEYWHAQNLGGRRKAQPNSKNTAWNNSSFRGYADYMETVEFENAVAALEQEASKAPTVFMCAEAVWWRCHRSMIADCLKAKGWTVMHITAASRAREHSYTAPAKISGSKVSYAA